MTAAPCSTGFSFRRSGTRHAAAGVELYISLIMIAPFGIGGGLAGPTFGASGRYFFSQATVSGEYQISTGICVARSLPLQTPLSSVPKKGPASRTVLSI